MIIGLAVIVVNYASADLLEDNLIPLLDSVQQNRVFVVDNFSSDDERKRVEFLALRGWTPILLDTNLGFGSGMNIGIERATAAGATTFLLVNPDAVIRADDVSTLFRHVQADPLALVSPRILRPDGSVWFNGSDLYLRDGRIKATRRRPSGHDDSVQQWLSGACLMVTQTLWQRVGGFSEKYFLYWEDVDLCHRVLRSGGRLRVCEDAVAIHAEGGTQGSGHQIAGGEKSARYYYFNIRNRLLFAAENLDSNRLRDWMRWTVPVAREVLLQGGRRQFLRSPQPVIAGIRGVRDGLKIARRELARRTSSP